MTKVLAALLVYGLLFVASGKTDDYSPDKIIALEKAALDRWGKGDPQGYLEIMDDDLTYFDPLQEKRLDGLGAMKEFIKPFTGKIKVDRFDMINPKVQRDGNMAVLTFNLLDHGATLDGVDQGTPCWNSTEVYRRIDGRWKIVHSHWSYAKADTTTDAQKLRALHVAWAKAFAAKDLDAIVNHYADDAYVELANTPIIRGKAAIRAQTKQALADPNFALTFAPDQVEVSKGADLAYVRGTYTVTSPDPVTKRLTTAQGKYIVIYRRDGNGQWKVIHDINNRDGR
jgi:uncharacterized protein (TIGR02246 family)